jgi:hypothetical protein
MSEVRCICLVFPVHLLTPSGRLVRLIPDDPDNDESEKAAIKAFFNHRLPKERDSARQEWLQIVEAEHALWTNISTAKRELIRSILNVVAFEIVKRRRPSSSFDFSGASIGNLFLTGYVLLRFGFYVTPASLAVLRHYILP